MAAKSSVPQHEALEMLRHMRSDFPFYAERALQIRAKSGAIQPFTLNRAQRHLHQCIQDQLRDTGKVRIVGLKGRQQGFSTYVEGRFYWRVSGEFGKRAFILTHLAEATSNIFAMTRRYHDLCAPAVKPSTKANSGTSLQFDRLQSEFSVATAGSQGAGRSATAQYFHGSEMAFWPNAADHMAGIGQIVPNQPKTEVILESTANGIGNVFHGMVEDAQAGRGEYRLVFVPWFWQDEYRLEVPKDFEFEREDLEYAEAFGLDLEQLYWRHQKLISDFRGDRALFDQEYPATVSLAFRRVAGDPLIPVELVMSAIAAKVEPVGAKIMGIDPAEYGDDDTVFALRQGREVFHVERHNKKGPMEVVGLASIAIDRFSPDIINVDCTGVGSGVADRLKELGYPVNRVHFGERAIDQGQYGIRRDEIWGEMKKWFQDKPVSLPKDDRLIVDITAPQYTYDSSRRLKLESKEQMRKRGLKSPDAGDALALTFAVTYSLTLATRKIDHNRRLDWRTA